MDWLKASLCVQILKFLLGLIMICGWVPRPIDRSTQIDFISPFVGSGDTAGGLVTDWGVHLLDVVLWGMNATANRIVSSGGNFAYPNSLMETPDTQQAIFEFPDFTMIWEHANGIGLGPYQRSHGIAFIGNNGTLIVDRGRLGGSTRD